jgi:hypothetical protein
MPKNMSKSIQSIWNIIPYAKHPIMDAITAIIKKTIPRSIAITSSNIPAARRIAPYFNISFANVIFFSISLTSSEE